MFCDWHESVLDWDSGYNSPSSERGNICHRWFLRAMTACCLVLSVTCWQPCGAAIGDSGADADVVGPIGPPYARISYPSTGSMVRADVPVFGVAHCRDFKEWRLEVALKRDVNGELIAPIWRLLAHGVEPIADDPYAAGEVKWDANVGPRGNIYTWSTGAPSYDARSAYPVEEARGVYRLRLTVEGAQRKVWRDEVELQIADVFSNHQGGFTESPDGIVRIELDELSLFHPWILVGVSPLPEFVASTEGLERIGHAYEVRRPGISFSEPARMYFKFNVEREGSANGVGIYWYDWKSDRWLPCDTSTTHGGRMLSTRLANFAPRWAIYALLRDVMPPPVPMLEEVAEETSHQFLDVSGKCEPGSEVFVTKAGDVIASATTTVNGEFCVAQIPLESGPNEMSIFAVDKAKNRSREAGKFSVFRVVRPPKNVRLMSISRPDKALPGATYEIGIEGDDSSPDTVDTTYVRVATRSSVEESLSLELVETGKNTGVYIGKCEINESCDVRAESSDMGSTGVRLRKDGDELVFTSLVDDSVSRKLVYEDKIGPPAPSVTISHLRQQECWTFEESSGRVLDAWKGVGGSAGATVSVETDSGNSFLKMTPQHADSHIGLEVPLAGTVEISETPIISFDYLVPESVAVDILLRCPGSSWGTLKLFISGSGALRPVGYVMGTKADGRWRHISIDMRDVSKPGLSGEKLSSLSSLRFGRYKMDRINTVTIPSTKPESYYCIDNFQIGSPPSEGGIEISWECIDPSGIGGYNLVIDQELSTVPTEQISTAETQHLMQMDGRKGRWFVHVRAVDSAGNWGETSHVPVTFGDIAEVITGKPGEAATKLREDGRLEESAALEAFAAYRRGVRNRVKEMTRLRRSLVDYTRMEQTEQARLTLYRYLNVDESMPFKEVELTKALLLIRSISDVATSESMFRAIALEVQERQLNMAYVLMVDGLARMLIENELYEAAQEVCKEQIAKCPERSLALVFLSICYSKHNRVEELAAVSEELEDRFGILIEDDDWDRILIQTDISPVKNLPAVRSFRVLIAKSCLEEKDYNGAVKILKPLLVAPFKPELVVFEVLSQSYSKLGNRDELETTCQYLKELYPAASTRAEAVLVLSRMNRTSARCQDAIDELQDLVAGDISVKMLRKAIPELLRAAWELASDSEDVRNHIAILLDAPPKRRANNLKALKFAIIALEADDYELAAETACLAIIQHAAGSKEAEWANRRLSREK